MIHVMYCSCKKGCCNLEGREDTFESWGVEEDMSGLGNICCVHAVVKRIVLHVVIF
jgi:hypothetical protein